MSNAIEASAPAPKRVLFAVADPHTVTALRDALHRPPAPWDIVFAASGAEAMQQLDKAGIDVLVSDLALPGTQGLELLDAARTRHPEVIRLCLSGALDDERFLRAVPLTHQFLAKPCPSDTLHEVIERACALGTLLQQQAIRTLIGRLDTLPATPRTFQALSAAMAQPTAHTADICEIVSSDQQLCIKTLQIVNSALFRRSAPITSIAAAINFVGLEMLKSLALSACVFNALDAAPGTARMLADLQNRSLRKARFAHRLLDGQHGADEAFTAALLLDVGEAVLALVSPERFGDMVLRARASARPWHLVEPECFGVAHPEVGACLLGLWGLPLELVEAVAHHHCPSAVGHTHTHVLAAVHVADAIVDASADQPPCLAEHLDGAFIGRPEVARCLAQWSIDVSAEALGLQRTRAA